MKFSSLCLLRYCLRLSLLLLVFNGCAKKDVPQTTQIIKLLSKCPAWTHISEGDDRAKKEVIVYMKRIAVFDPATIRSAILNCTLANESNGVQNIDELSKIFLLNRFLFNVPQFDNAAIPIFGAWRSPLYADRIDRLWPLTKNQDGHFELTGIFTGYTGEPYKAVEEFDFFKSRYGLRSVN